MWAWSRSTPIDAAHQHAMGCVSLRLVAMETQLRRDFKSATRLFSGLKERGHYTIGLECVYILSVQRMPGTWTDSWVEKEGFLRYGKTPCKKWSPSSQKWSPSSTSVRPLKWWVHNSTEESHFWFIGRVLPPSNSNLACTARRRRGHRLLYYNIILWNTGTRYRVLYCVLCHVSR